MYIAEASMLYHRSGLLTMAIHSCDSVSFSTVQGVLHPPSRKKAWLTWYLKLKVCGSDNFVQRS